METQHGVLAPDAGVKVALSGNYNDLEVLNRDGAGEIYFTIDGSTPTVGGTDCLVLPAAVGSLRVPSPSQAAAVVRLVAATQTAYSVRAVEPWGATPADPTALAGRAVRFEADRIAADNGSAIAGWPDSSGNERHARPITTTKRPIYTTGQANGWPAVTGDGVDDVVITGPHAALDFTAFTFALVMRVPVTLPSFKALLGKYQDTVAGYDLNITNGGTLRLTVRGSSSIDHGTPGVGADLRDGLWHVHTCTAGSSAINLWKDGALVNTTSGTWTPAFATSSGLGLFARGTSSVSFAEVSFAEVIFYNRVLTGTERRQVEAYLGAKYAITVV